MIWRDEYLQEHNGGPSQLPTARAQRHRTLDAGFPRVTLLLASLLAVAKPITGGERLVDTGCLPTAVGSEYAPGPGRPLRALAAESSNLAEPFRVPLAECSLCLLSSCIKYAEGPTCMQVHLSRQGSPHKGSSTAHRGGDTRHAWAAPAIDGLLMLQGNEYFVRSIACGCCKVHSGSAGFR